MALFAARLAQTVDALSHVRNVPRAVVEVFAKVFDVSPVICFITNWESFKPLAWIGLEDSKVRQSSCSAWVAKQISTGDNVVFLRRGSPCDAPGAAECVQPESAALGELGISALLALRFGGHLVGAIGFGHKNRILSSSSTVPSEMMDAASSIALVMEYYRLRVLHEEELARAWDIQKRLLPLNVPTHKNLDISVRFRPARTVSGDFYEFLWLSNGKMGVAIGDVAGKGLPAAMVMGNVISMLRRKMLLRSSGLSELMSELCALVYDSSPPAVFATMFYAVIDLDRLAVEYTTAGHDPPALLIRLGRDVSTSALSYGGMVLGLLRDPPAPYLVGKVALRSGDSVVMATDGVTEAFNPAGEQWGREAFTEAAQSACVAYKTADEISNCLLDELDAFIGGAPQSDDITLIVCRIL